LPSFRDIVRRIDSIKNTQKITKAMQVVAATRLRRAQAAVQATRPYADKMVEVLQTVGERGTEYKHPFLVRREGGRWAVSDGRKTRPYDHLVLAMPVHEAIGCFDGVPAEVLEKLDVHTMGDVRDVLALAKPLGWHTVVVDPRAGLATRERVPSADELIVGFEIPRIHGRQWFRKVGTRAAQAISKVVMAGVNSPASPRVALGSVGPTVVRAVKTEAALAGGRSIARLPFDWRHSTVHPVPLPSTG